MVYKNLLISSSLRLISIFIVSFKLFLLIIPSISFIFLILFSISIQSLISEFKLLSFHSLSINFPFSNDILILLGNFSLSLIISSFINISLIN